MGWLLLAALLLTALVIVALGVALVMLRGVQRRRRTFTISDATIDDAWTRWIDGRELSDAERTLRAALLELLDPPTLAAVLADLRRLEAATVAARAPLVAVREEIMASVDRRMLNTEILRLSDAQRAEVCARSSDALGRATATRAATSPPTSGGCTCCASTPRCATATRLISFITFMASMMQTTVSGPTSAPTST